MTEELDFQSVSLLIRQAKNGCQQSKSELIDQLQSYMHLLANRFSNEQLQHRLGNSDIVQQSVVNVIEKFDGFRGSSRGEFKAWLKQILLNEIRQSVRNHSRAKRDVARERSIDHSQLGVGGSLTDDQPTPRTDAIQREQLVLMKEAINKLPPDYQKVIRLRSLDRLPFDEVADQMERSVAATTKLWYRAVMKLQEGMGKAP